MRWLDESMAKLGFFFFLPVSYQIIDIKIKSFVKVLESMLLNDFYRYKILVHVLNITLCEQDRV